ncbi:MAG: outer membrane beta-barrel protein [Alistipes sp.]|nr:outer membrane beta-barrel protein [Alistipes sp.]
MKKLFFLVIACVVASTASAQFVNSGNANVAAKSGTSLSSMSTDDYNRFYVGYNPTKINWEDDQEDNEEGFPLTQSLTAGYLHASSLSSSVPLFLEYGANFQYSFGKESNDGDDLTVNMYSVNVPISLAFKAQFNDVSLTPYLGVNFRVNAAGTLTYDDEDTNIFDDSDKEAGDNAAKRFQAGINFGVGLSYKAIYLGVGYLSDFSKFIDNNDDDNVGKMGAVTLTVGINF